MMCLVNPKLEQFRFDWEPTTRKLYIVPLEVLPLIGEPICENVQTPELARLIVSAWCNGYMAHQLDQSVLGRTQHYRMLAENATFGATLGPRFTNGDGR